MQGTSGTSKRAAPAYIKFLSLMDMSQWSRLDQSIIDGLCHPKSLLEYWDDIINDKCAGVDKAFLITYNGDVEGFYSRRLFSSVVELYKKQKGVAHELL